MLVLGGGSSLPVTSSGMAGCSKGSLEVNIQTTELGQLLNCILNNSFVEAAFEASKVYDLHQPWSPLSLKFELPVRHTRRNVKPSSTINY
jgi:hypothetical protein